MSTAHQPVSEITAQEARLLDKLREKGGHAGNVTLQKELAGPTISIGRSETGWSIGGN